ncbi:AbrB/MazE/SpoVT family DNA-binding domain-containing protein [Sphingoaurantiacus capsulatus]|uniref:AbrB/MazE/SpoVT family DNA-binding domain-containing protein n=1 Tax=Sphingoaurantiacus capsulatus TaxID=1771310 RepID=A0ABV7X9A3_9SPHN
MNAPSTRLSAKGQVVIPKEVRDAKHWLPGTAFEVVDRPDGVLLRPLKRYGTRPIDEVLAEIRSIVNYQGPPGDEESWRHAIDEMFKNKE